MLAQSRLQAAVMSTEQQLLMVLQLGEVRREELVTEPPALL
ncbi:hypothetical protein [Mumia zhuanghuii]|nr:hypothetical protein [Mumia zhuanghuii]